MSLVFWFWEIFGSILVIFLRNVVLGKMCDEGRVGKMERRWDFVEWAYGWKKMWGMGEKVEAKQYKNCR